MSGFTRTFEKIKKIKQTEIWVKYVHYRFKFLNRIGLHRLFHAGFWEIISLKWGRSFKQFEFLVFGRNKFSRRFAFTQTNIFFHKIKKYPYLRKINVS